MSRGRTESNGDMAVADKADGQSRWIGVSVRYPWDGRRNNLFAITSESYVEFSKFRATSLRWALQKERDNNISDLVD
jgi:hypothetical protein